MKHYSLSNGNLQATVHSKGAELQSVRNSSGREFMWNAGPEWPKHAPNLFPIVGSLKENVYTLNGDTFSMNRHGFARNMDFELESQTEDELIFLLTDTPETHAVYPFSFEFRVHYKLIENTLRQTYRVKNTANETMWAAFGGHPAFAASPIENWKISLNQAVTLDAQILSGELLGEERISGFKDGILTLDAETFNKDALVFLNIPSREITLSSTEEAYFVRMRFDDFPHLGIWSKPGAGFVCLEPWQGVADFVTTNQQLEDKFGMLEIPGKETIAKTFTMEFGSNQKL